MSVSLPEFRAVIASHCLKTTNAGFTIIENEWQPSSFLFDFRSIFLQAHWLQVYARLFWERFCDQYPFQVCGMESAALPLVTAVVLEGAQRGTPVNGLYIRKSRKRFGLTRLIEGAITPEPVILLDDIVNSGETLLKQVKVLADAALTTSGAFAVVSSRAPTEYPALAKHGVKLTTLFTLADFGITDAPVQTPVTLDAGFTLQWRYRPPSPSHHLVVQKSSLAVWKKFLFYGRDDGCLVSLDQVTGSVHWEFYVGKHPFMRGVLSSPAIHGDTVYFGAYDGTVYALEAASGKIRWRYDGADWVGSSPALAPSLGCLFIGLEYGLWRRHGGIVALDLGTGRPRWCAYHPTFTHGTPLFVAEENLVIIGSNDETVYAYDASTGNLCWKQRIVGNVKGSFAYDAQSRSIFGGSVGGGCYAFAVETGTIRWSMMGGGLFSTPLVYDNAVFFASLDKHLYSFDIQAGVCNWSFETAGRIFSSPIYHRGIIWFGSNDGKLYGVDVNTGKGIKCFQASERINNKIVFTDEANLFFTTNANEVYALKVDY